MFVYIYQSALLCADCGEKIRHQLAHEGKAPADSCDPNCNDNWEERDTAPRATRTTEGK